MTKLQLLLSTVEIAEIHQKRLNEALVYLKDILPIDEAKLAQLSSQDYAYLDVVAVRYAKLQDIIGSKIFYLLLEVMEETVESNRFLDVLERLEKVGILESVDFWIELRNVRNFVAHEYPEEPLLLIKNINLLHVSSVKLLKFWDDLLREATKLS